MITVRSSDQEGSYGYELRRLLVPKPILGTFGAPLLWNDTRPIVLLRSGVHHMRAEENCDRISSDLGHAAIGKDNATAQISTVARRKKQRDLGDIFRHSDAAERYRAHHLVEHRIIIVGLSRHS